MKRSLFLLFISILILKSSPSFAWGFKGHKMVADIAKTYMDKAVQDSVQKYLGTMTFEDAATWMDDFRKDTSYNYMKPWHYINVEKDETYVQSSEANIVNEIEIARANLKGWNRLSTADNNKSVKVLFHLIGDLHMPLHAGYASDKGGNSVDVQFLDKKSNLHRVWDTDIIEEKKITAEECLKLAPKLTKEEISKIQKVDVVAWMNQSRALLPEVYAFQNGTIDKAYIDKNEPVIEKQLLEAGMRLAAVMNEIFKK